jgi:hypothetical protein
MFSKLLLPNQYDNTRLVFCLHVQPNPQMSLQGLSWNDEGWLEPDHHQQYGNDYPTFFEAKTSGLRRRTGVHALTRPYSGAQVIHPTRKPGSAARGSVEGRIHSAGLWGSERERREDDVPEKAEQEASSIPSLQAADALASEDVTAVNHLGKGEAGSENGVPVWLGNEGGWATHKASDEEEDDSDGQGTDGQTAAVGEDGELETELADEARKVSSAGLFDFLWKPRKGEAQDLFLLRKGLAMDREQTVDKDRVRNPWDDGDDRPRKLLLSRGSLGALGGQLLRGGWRSGHKEEESRSTAGSAENGHHKSAHKEEEQGKTAGGERKSRGKQSGPLKKEAPGQNVKGVKEGKESDGQERPWYRWQWKARESEADERSRLKTKEAVSKDSNSQTKEQNEVEQVATFAGDQLWRFWLKGAAPHELHESHAAHMQFASAE